jgi:7,8-dihydropterin-6-yl-methyl-4-(beta-D-ribofuranosyl)aminobenzene 5'-phosphate synthase
VADRIEMTVLVDNYIDIFIPSAGVADYPVPGKASQLWAEQGFSLWIEVSENGRSRKILYDFGRSDTVLLHNAALLEKDFGELDHLVLSHGHVDHYGCLLPVLENTKEQCTLTAHPKAYGRKRFLKKGDKTYAGPWDIEGDTVDRFVSRIEPTIGSSDLGMGIHVTGVIERNTDFEPGMPNAFVEVDGELRHDDIPDDQSILIELKGRGIVVLTGCCHAGVVNTLSHAQKMFPGQQLYALVGGLHLNSAGDEQMTKTIEALSRFQLTFISPLHCTGYHAQRTLMDHFRDQWLPGTVGATFTFAGTK